MATSWRRAAAHSARNIRDDVFHVCLAERLAADHRYQEAEPVYAEALETQRRILGAEHQDTLFTMLGLGAAYFNQHR